MDREKLFVTLNRIIYKKNNCVNKDIFYFLVDSLLDLDKTSVNPLTEKETYIFRIKFGILSDCNINIDAKYLDFIFIKIKHYVDALPDNKSRLSSLLLYENNLENTDISLLFNDMFLESGNKLIVALYRNGINTVYDLLSYSKLDLLKLDGCGVSYVFAIIDCLHKNGLRLINELSTLERKKILCLDYSQEVNCDMSEVIDNSSFALISGASRIYYSSIRKAKQGIGIIKNIPLDIIKFFRDLDISSLSSDFDLYFSKDIPDASILGKNRIKKNIYNYILEQASKLEVDIDLSKLELYLDSFFDFSVDRVGLLDEIETIIMRYYLIPLNGEKNFTIKDTGIELGYKDDLYFRKFFSYIRLKMIYSINRYPLTDNVSRFSTLLYFENYSEYQNYSITNLDVTPSVLLVLYKNNIFTLYDLLSYSELEILNLFNNKLSYSLNRLFTDVRGKGFYFIDSFSYSKKREVFDKVISYYKEFNCDYQEKFFFMLHNSSVFWLNIFDREEYKKISEEIVIKYSTIGSLKEKAEDTSISPFVFMSVNIENFSILTPEDIILLHSFNINTMFDLINASREQLLQILKDDSYIKEIDSFCEYYGLNSDNNRSLVKNVLGVV